jgi:hypothetical protein
MTPLSAGKAHRTARPRRWPLLCLSTTLIACLATALVPAMASAKIRTFGSPLSVPATLNTAENLGYPGTNTAVPPSPEAPNGVFHTFHYGADTAIWNVGQASGLAQAPATGQALKVSLEGCAESAQNGPSPLTQIHFQDLSPLPGGGARVNITSQGFEIPVCGQNGASGSTVTSYEPVNLCVSAGDYVGFNDEGGYVENVYRNGVPYKVLGAVEGSMADSFLLNNGTGNGATLSPSVTNADYGFAANEGKELLMQVTLGTGSDATHICAGGTAGLPPALAPIRVSPQTDGINHERIVAVAVYCRLQPTCQGVATLSLSNLSGYAGKSRFQRATVGRAGFNLAPDKTTHLPIRLSSSVMGLIRKDHGIAVTLTAVVAGKTITQQINVKIL